MGLDKAIKQYSFLPEFIIRRPGFSLRNSKIEDQTETFISNLLENKEFTEAIFVSSPDLYSQMDKLREKSLNVKERNNIIQALIKFWMRMSTRSTPFGLFSGCGIGIWAENTNLSTESKYRCTRLDIDVIRKLSKTLSEYSKIKYQIKFYPNNTIYEVGSKLRYIDMSVTDNDIKYFISSVATNDYLTDVLKESGKGALLIDLVNLLVRKGIDPNEAAIYIEELVTANILISELFPSVYSIDYLESVIEKLNIHLSNSSSKEILNVIDHLQEIKHLLSEIDSSFSNDTDQYISICKKIRSIIQEEVNGIQFQVDTFFDCKKLCLNNSIQQRLTEIFNLLNKLYSPEQHSNLTSFITKYQLRYEDAEVPLLVALDSENGIGYSSNTVSDTEGLLEGITPVVQQSNFKSFQLNPASEIIFREIQDCLRNGGNKVELTDEMFLGIHNSVFNISPVQFAQFSVIDSNDKIFLNHFGSGIDLMGRFIHADKQFEDLARKIVLIEEQFEKNCIIADIAFLPEGRAGNIAIHPRIRSYEIPIFERPIETNQGRIDLSDLSIKIVQGQIYLISRSENKFVFPKISSAHNYNNSSIPVYKFLCDLQNNYYSKSALRFKGEVYYSILTYTPRIEYNNSILSRATWNFTKSNCNELFDESMEINERIKKWRNRWGIPEQILLVEGDNELLFDLSNGLSVRTLINIILKRKSFLITEFLFETKGGLNNSSINFANEVISYFQVSSKGIFDDIVLPSKLHTEVKSGFSIGDEWLFYKLYCGIKNSDKILTNVLNPLIEKLLHAHLIMKWFFIRYNDPDNHIRLRIQVSNVKQIGEIILSINVALSDSLKDGLIHKISLDTYNRELDRYGTLTIGDVESIFFIDSVKAVELLNLPKKSINKSKWIFAIKSIDDLLNSLSMTIIDKKNFTEKMFDSYFKEHNGNKTLQHQLNAKFRLNREEIESTMKESGTSEKHLDDIILLAKSKKIEIDKVISSVISDETKRDDFINNLFVRISGIIHMMINRIFTDKQRTYEMAIYYMMFKFYKSESGKLKQTKKIKIEQNE